MDCPAIPIADGEEFFEEMLAASPQRRLPLDGSIEITGRCNLRCAHCYISRDVADKDAAAQELTHQELCRLIDEIVDEGCLWLLITGGEPFVRQDTLDVFTYARKKGLLVTLFTNATLLTPRIADMLAEWGPSAVEITMYGRTQQTYEVVTRVPGSYGRFMQGIELLLERDVPLALKAMVFTLNRHEIWDMKDYAESLGVKFRFDGAINARVDGGRQPINYRLSPEEILELDVGDSRRIDEMRRLCQTHWGPPAAPDRLYYCGAGWLGFHVDSYGQMSVCLMSREPSWDLRRRTFRDGWLEFIPQVLAQKRKSQTPCQDCELISLCDQCPGWAWMESGDPEAPVDFLCKVARLRAGRNGSMKEGKY